MNYSGHTKTADVPEKGSTLEYTANISRPARMVMASEFASSHSTTKHSANSDISVRTSGEILSLSRTVPGF